MNKDANRKEPLKSLISKVGTFRGKKNGQQTQRSSASDLKYPDSSHDESIMKSHSEEPLGPFESSDLDTTTKSYYGSNSYRFFLIHFKLKFKYIFDLII